MGPDGCGCITVYAIDFARSSLISNGFWVAYNQCYIIFLVFSNASILHVPLEHCWFVISDLNQIFLIQNSSNFFLFLGIFMCMFMWSGVLMKSMTSKWSSLIFLMAATLLWLTRWITAGPEAHKSSCQQVYTQCTHTHTSAISAMVQMYYCNYQSAPQPPNSGIRLSSVTWCSSDGGSTCARL